MLTIMTRYKQQMTFNADDWNMWLTYLRNVTYDLNLLSRSPVVSILENIDCVIPALHSISNIHVRLASLQFHEWSCIQFIPRNMHTVFALLCFVVVIHWLISPYPSGLLHWHCGNLTIAPVPAKQPWWIWINTSCEFIMNDCITTTKQSTTTLCAYFLGYTVSQIHQYANSLECFKQTAHTNLHFLTWHWH